MRLIRVGWLRWPVVVLLGLLALPAVARAETFCIDSNTGVQKRFAVEPTTCATGQNLLCYSTTLSSWSACTSGGALETIAAGSNFSANSAANAFKVCGNVDQQNCPINAYVHATKGPINDPICSGGACDPLFEVDPGKTMFFAQSDGSTGLQIAYDEIQVFNMLQRGSDASNPGTGRCKLYPKSDGFYVRCAGAAVVGPLGHTVRTKHFRPHDILPDGAQCVPGTAQINSGPVVDSIICTANAAAILYGDLPVAEIGGCPSSTISMTLRVISTGSATFAGSFSAMYRGSTAAINSTWGTGVAANVTLGTANEVESAAANVTPNGTCAADSILFWRYAINSGSHTATAAHVKGVTVANP